ncbi:MAG: UDP-3-O-[3-hydroxymyristoyl] N-acetylglucosamine deacetylase [Alphaproteobacteria bacterium]|nr:UDP-3-O-[3-hydroxymyristoyl] N-acetylglucosamine deacetylase [Alphaproteobacteria bacterium]
MPTQTTIAAPARVAGIGVHSAAPVDVRLLPAAPGTGIVFVRTDLAGDAAIPARAGFVSATANATVLRNAAGAEVSTVEHLLAAAFGLAIDNLRVEIDGPEMPILDGSAAPFAAALEAAGRVAQDGERPVLRIVRRVEVSQGDKTAALEPFDDGFEIDVTIRYQDAAIGVQRRALRVTPESFAREIAPARTFGLYRDLDALHARGLARGASLDNTVAVDGDRVVNPDGLRWPDEFVRHKILDVVGDLALLGAPIRGRFVGDQCGHGLNARLTAAVLATPDCYEMSAR